MKKSEHWSRLAGFFGLKPEQRRLVLTRLPLSLELSDFAPLDQALPLELADAMSENVIGSFALPFAVAPNFVIDGQAVIVPMVTEEPSIVAAVSKMAKIIGSTGGFFTKLSDPIITGQLQFYSLPDIDRAEQIIRDQKNDLIEQLNCHCESMVARGGGVIDLNARVLSAKIGPMLIVEALVNVCDAMGANAVNTLMEILATKLRPVLGGKMGIAILSNLCDKRMAQARCTLPWHLIADDPTHDNGWLIAEKIMAAHAFAEADRYRACTHNKGILNGIDAVALATGNDFRAIEAGAHAFAASTGCYQPLTALWVDEEKKVLRAELNLPLAVGIVGGNCGTHQGVRLAHKLLGSLAQSGQGLASVMVSVGLAQCLAALLALSDGGIQKGHMKLHQKKALMKQGKQ